MQEGNRSLSIVSIDPANFTLGSTKRVTEMLRRNKIHIGAIKETPIQKDYRYEFNGYRIITSASIREQENTKALTGCLPTTGVAIMIHTELEHHITHIERINEHIIQVTLHSTHSHTPLTI